MKVMAFAAYMRPPQVGVATSMESMVCVCSDRCTEAYTASGKMTSDLTSNPTLFTSCWRKT